MPNWCANNLVVKGNIKNVVRFIKENFNTKANPYNDSSNQYDYVLDFEKFLPTPLDENGELIKDWYDWRYQNWGCKWSPNHEQSIQLDVDNKIYYNMLRRGVNEEELFNEKLMDNLPEEGTAELICYYETPWSPALPLVDRWFEAYGENVDLELKCGYYEPGCAFAGEYGWKGNEMFSEDYELDESKESIEYLLNTGWEDVDWFKEVIKDVIECKFDDKGEEFTEKLLEKIYDTLDKATTNLERATLISSVLEERKNKDQ